MLPYELFNGTEVTIWGTILVLTDPTKKRDRTPCRFQVRDREREWKRE